MDQELRRLVKEDTPPLNETTANGLACTYIPLCEKYIDDVWRAVSASFPEGVKYLGSRRMLPPEELRETAKKNQRNQTKGRFDMARTDIFMRSYHFSVNGEELPPKYLQLPFVSDAGEIYIGGSRFVISPVLSDRVISPTLTGVFIRLLMARLTIDRMNYDYIAHSYQDSGDAARDVAGYERGRRESVQIPWSRIYNGKMRNKPMVQARSTLAHYLFCKYGLTETFRKFANCQVVVGKDDINPQNYPPDQWVICRTTYTHTIKPRGVKSLIYKPTELRLAIRVEEYTPMVKSLVAGFFYVADHYPTQIELEYVDSLYKWRIALGYAVIADNIGHGDLYDEVCNHIDSLDKYVDTVTHKTLQAIGVPVDDVYELFAVVLEQINSWARSASESINSLYGKEPNILYYVMFEITSAIVLLYFKLKSAAKEGLDVATVKNIFQMSTLKPGLINKIRQDHIELSTEACPGDNKAFKITSIMVPQANSSRQAGRKDRGTAADPTKHLHFSTAEIAGYTNISKGDPSGHSRMNLHARLDEHGVFVQNPYLAELFASVQELIKRRLPGLG